MANTKIWRTGSVCKMVLISLLLSSCSERCTKPCGEFNFLDIHVIDSENIGGTVSNGWEMTVEFDFNPSDCSEDCGCNKVAWVQMLRAIDQSDGTYLYANEEKEDRATAEGWHIDRLQGRQWGYYGRNDDGTFAGTVTTGSTTTTASLYDRPRRPDSEPYLGFLWMAVTVPVCIDNVGSSCNNKLLGFYEWAWFTSDRSDVAVIHWISPKGFKDDFDSAVSEWNTDAPGLGYNTFPVFTRLSE